MARTTQPSLAGRLEALDRVLELADGRVDAERAAQAEALRAKARARLARGDEAVVAALVGGTGSGKSSLFNALARAPLSPIGVRRPTTEVARAVVGPETPGADRLLDWLEVQHRHEGGPDVPAGLVLIDVPDHDSVAQGHRVVVDRLVERVDVLVWVVDPIKYAMRALHESYLGPLAAHADVVLVVLNRIDELADADLATCVRDLRRLLDAEGLQRARLLTTSARTGHGVAELHAALAEEATARSAAARRIVGDLRDTATSLSEDVGTLPPGPLDNQGVVAALAGAAGIAGVAAAAADESRRGALAGTRPVVSRAAVAVTSRGPALLRHLRALVPGLDARPRPAAHTAPIGVRHAVVEVVDRCAEPLPVPWRARLQEASGVDTGALARAVSAAVDRVPLRSPRRWWWAVVAFVLSLFELAALVGFLWLTVLAVVGWLQLPVPDVPAAVGEVSWPAALLLGGAALRAIGGALRRRLVSRGAERHRRRVAAQLLEAVRQVAEERLVAPLRAELDVREELRRLLASLRA